MQATYIVSEHILRVIVKGPEPNKLWVYQKAVPAYRIWFGLVKVDEIQEGWIQLNSYNSPISLEKVLKTNPTVFIKNDVIFNKAVVCIESIGGQYTNKTYSYFETFEEADNFAKDILKDKPTIHIKYQ